ncbi:MAG TPA: thioredoxin family protein [Candidatus Acidoferrales bacterium]|nr:thioredoxin family protein [Candidatus Acidoferrales bacterium]
MRVASVARLQLIAAMSLLGLGLFSAPRALPQAVAPVHSTARQSGEFAPVHAWKLAVLSGNTAALRDLYSSDPPSAILTSKGEIRDPDEEPQFWLAAKSNGLQRLKLRIRKRDSPQPGVQRVMFELQADMKPGAADPKLFAAVAQYWLKEDGTWRIVATQRTQLARLPQPVELLLPQPTEENPGPHPIYPNAAEAKADIAAALASASRQHKRVLLDFGGNWCSDCHILDQTFRYPEVARVLDPNFVVVHINIGQYDQNLDLAAKYQIPLKRGVPSLAVLDSKGDLLVSQRNGDFENTTKIGLKDVESFLNQWKP